jgi:hypothetical protein
VVLAILQIVARIQEEDEVELFRKKQKQEETRG